jgi:hypothetical protein
MDEPVLNYDFTLPEAAAGGGWQEANRYSIWVGKQDPDAAPYEVWLRQPEGVVRLPAGARTMRLIPAGTPFRVAHLFAPWHISDADTVYMRVERGDGIYHLLVMTAGPTVDRSHAVWFCAGCGKEMARKSFDTKAHGLTAFWPFLRAEVRSFNTAPASHICAGCGARHPPCYGFDPKDDTEDEAAARALW